MVDVDSGSIPAVVDLHVEEACGLYTRRAHLTHAPLVSLQSLRRSDERLRAHLDGIAIAGELKQPALERGLAGGAAGATFTAAGCAVQDHDERVLERVFLEAAGAPDSAHEAVSALGWVSSANLKGLGVALLDSNDPVQRDAGFAACAMHRVDPRILSARRLDDPVHAVRARALRTAGELGFA